ncbi:MAG: hypothetical protein K5660_02195, partial [Paludibacteraceae bacterium]|nr:hypothetical protein [Paludibacteraceae bacterium]
PDHELLEQSKDYMTGDFYAVLDTLFNLPEHEAMDHEWLYYFVTGNGGTIAEYEVLDVKQTDPEHAIATISVRQKWEDGSYDPESDIELHQMSMEYINNQWLMSDFDGHKEDCIRHIAINRKEQTLRQTIRDYLVSQIGSQYLQGELCFPTLLIVYETDSFVLGDFWVEWFNRSNDSLCFVSGGNHSGKIAFSYDNNQPYITSFLQTVDGAGNDASARRIFGEYYDIYCNIHSNPDVRDAAREEQMNEYFKIVDKK